MELTMSQGSRNPKAKLTEDDVVQIRRSSLGQSVLASQYGVSIDTIWNIRSRKTWKHIDAADDVPKIGDGTEWKPVVGYEGIYEIANDGQVRRCSWPRHCPRPVRKAKVCGGGYACVVLSLGNRQYKPLLHRLVMRAFVGPPPPGKEVNHKNGNKQDNRLDNLEYVTSKENQQHASRMRLKAFGMRNHSAKLSDVDVLTILGLPGPGRKIAERYGVSQSAIARIRQGKTWAHLHDTPLPTVT